MSAAIAPELRAVLATVAESMIPGGHGMPSASEVDLAGRLLDQVLTARPDLEAPLARVLARLRGLDADAARAHLEADRAALDVFALVAIGGYMLHPAVGAALSYPGQQPKPVNPFDINDVVDEGLLDPVIERGPIYREVPT
jgi:hypothetical protein